MALNMMDGSWMGKISKATLLLLLPITMAFSSVTIGVAETAPLGTGASAANSSSIVKSLKDNKTDVTGFESINLERIEDLGIFVKQFPFLKFMQELDKDLPADLKSIVSAAVVKYDSNKKEILFIRSEGPGDCGTLGCGLMAYVKKDGTYQVALNMSVHDPLQIRKVDGNLLLYFCTNEGSKEWTILKDGTFGSSDSKTPAILPGCPAPY